MSKKVGSVATTSITHATAAAVYVRSAERNYEAEVPAGCTKQINIAQQVTLYILPLLHKNTSCNHP